MRKIDYEGLETVSHVAMAHMVAGGGRMDVHDELRDLVEENEGHAIPPGLMDLVAIRDFDLFVSSTLIPL